MARYAYERLSAQDTSFLVIESETAFTHAAATSIYDVGPLGTPDGGLDFATIRRSAESLLHRVPRFRQKLQWIPIEGEPIWVDDPAFDLDYHLRRTRLPDPGTERELKELSARLLANPMDLTKPPWEWWVIEGLEGDRFALVQRMHHCTIDGKSGVDLSQIMMSSSPQVEFVQPAPYVPRPAPSPGQLLRDSVRRRLRMPIDAMRRVRESFDSATALREALSERAEAVLGMASSMLQVAPDSPLNGQIGPHRRVDWLDMQLSDVKELRKALGGTVNDVVLAIVAGAVRRYVQHRGVDPAALTAFRVAAPVSIKPESERGKLGNHVSMWLLDLPIAESDPVARMERIRDQTHDLKESKQAVGAEVLFGVVEWTGTRILSLASRLVLSSTTPYNLMVTNVPGAQIPLYLCGALLRSNYAFVPLVAQTALGIALMSYTGVLSWGFNSDYDLLPDIDVFAAGITDAFTELQRAAGLTGRRTRTRKHRPQVRPHPYTEDAPSEET